MEPDIRLDWWKAALGVGVVLFVGGLLAGFFVRELMPLQSKEEAAAANALTKQEMNANRIAIATLNNRVQALQDRSDSMMQEEGRIEGQNDAILRENTEIIHSLEDMRRK
jgi:hypothetical protein